MNNIESTKGEIVMYQPDETIRLEVRVESETVWLSQAQMAELFGTKRPAITKHLNNIYKCEELLEESTCSILEHMGNDGKSSRGDRYLSHRSRHTQVPVPATTWKSMTCPFDRFVSRRFKSSSSML